MPDDLPPDLIDRVEAAARGQARVLLAIAGPPGAGKSTIADRLDAALDRAAILPMDGFHLDNEVLIQRGLLQRKGAPETFDTEGMLAMLHQIAEGGAVTVPTFDREADRVIPKGGTIDVDTTIILVEGNYLLLDEPGWREMQAFWDLTVAIDVPMAELERRLVQRWLDHGLSPQDAQRRAQDNDLRNAAIVRDRSAKADIVIRQG